MTSEAQKAANKRYRAKNYARCLEINLKSTKKCYSENDDIRKSRLLYAKKRYNANRNYWDVSNMGSTLKKLFQE